MQNLTLQDRLEAEASGETPEALLKRMLSIRSVVSTSSSFAQQQQAAIGTNAAFREIGTGSIGKVFEHPGTVFVYKLPITDNIGKLWNNYTKHIRIYSSFKSLPYVQNQVEIPRCFWYATPATESFWKDNLERFPELAHFPRIPRHALCMERIFPLPRPVRHALIDRYCPARARQQMKGNEANKDCLLRPCLGRLKYGTGSLFFTLRNFKLHANEIKELDLPVSDLCYGIAHAIAVLHWHTKIDGMDVEFVLGSSPAEEQRIQVGVDLARVMGLEPHTSTYEEATRTGPDFTKRITALWMIDFDDCSDITMDAAGVDMAVKAFIETNIYAPRPNSGDLYIDSLWRTFAEKYLQYSDNILENVLNTPELKPLPREFIQKVATETAARRQGSSGGRSYTPARPGSSNTGSPWRSYGHGRRNMGSSGRSSGSYTSYGSSGTGSQGGSWRRGGSGSHSRG